MSSISLVWAADTQKRARDSMMGVAGKPTTTVPMFLLSISRPKALPGDGAEEQVNTGRQDDNEGEGDGAGGERLPDFGRHVEHQGHDGRVVVAVDDEAHLAEPPAEVGGVLGELSQAVGT